MSFKKSLSWVLVIIWMIVIFILSSQPATDSSVLSGGITDWVYKLASSLIPTLNIDALHLIIRKLAHFTIYLILGALVLNALHYNNKKHNINFIIALVLAVLYAISDEIHQVFISGRSGQVIDVLIDFSGATLGVYIVSFHDRLKKNRTL